MMTGRQCHLRHLHRYIESYTNPNLTTWVDDYKQPNPKNKFLGEC